MARNQRQDNLIRYSLSLISSPSEMSNNRPEDADDDLLECYRFDCSLAIYHSAVGSSHLGRRKYLLVYSLASQPVLFIDGFNLIDRSIGI